MEDKGIPQSLRAVLTHELLSAEEELRLAKRAKQGDAAAISRLVECNTRLAYKAATEFARRKEDVDDFFSAGIVGLHRAAHRFNPLKCRGPRARFATYALWYVRSEMQVHLRRALLGSAALTGGGAALLKKVRAFQVTYRETVGSDPTAEEIAKGLGAKIAKVVAVLAVGGQVSLDAPKSQDDAKTSMHEVLMSDAPDAGALAENSDRRRALRAAVDELSDSERDVLYRRFGFVDGEEQTLDKIALSYRVTRERIRQIEAQGLRNLRLRIARRTSKHSELAA